jgi:carboxyl-terminal processing protease|tara:strand:- start:2264 stop:4297 length:2034 start_codon:yes stop_codon:yes gene_type:complete
VNFNIKHFVFISVLLFGSTLFSSDKVSNEKYINVLYEVENILEENHFKKNVTISSNQIKEKFLNSIDSQKMVFTLTNFNELSKQTNFNKEHQVEFAFEVFKKFKEKSFNYFEIQKEAILNITSENQLETQHFIFKDREDENRFDSEDQLIEYQIKEAKSELISILLKEKDLSKSKEKLLKRLVNREKSLNRISNDDIFSMFVNSFTSFYDPHTNYLTPKSQEDFEINMYLSLEGIGAILTIDDGITEIVRLIPGGPAEKSGLIKVSDKIVGVASKLSEEIQDVRDWRIDEVVNLIRGPKGTKVRLEVLSASMEDDEIGKLIEITRDVVKLEDQAAKKREIEIKRSGKLFNIGIIELPAFYMDFDAYKKNRYNYKSSSKDVRTLLRELDKNNSDGIILDLRGNGGGSLFEAYSLAKLFIGRGNVVQVMESNGSIQPLGHTMGRQNYIGPIAILVDKLSASASEILAGAIQDYQRGLVIGAQTFGKGTVQRMENLSYGQIKFTEQKFYRVSGQSTQHKGVIPDIELPYVYSNQEIGEMSYENALPYNDISPVYYETFENLTNLESIKRYSNNRIKDSFMNSYVKETKQLIEDENNKNLLPVNLTTRKDIKTKNEMKRLAIENELRGSLDLDIFESYEEFANSDGEEISDKKDEIILQEAAEILIDQILMEQSSRISYRR